MAMLSLKKVEFNYSEKEPCEQGCSWMIKFSYWLNFRYCKYGIIFSIQTQNGWTCCTQAAHTKKKKNILGSWFHFLNVLSRGVSLPFKCGKAVFRWSRRLKSQKFSLSMNHGILTLGVIHKCISSKVADFFCYFLNPLSPSLGDLAKKNSKVSLSNTQYDKYLNAESSLKQIQDAHFQWSSN